MDLYTHIRNILRNNSDVIILQYSILNVENIPTKMSLNDDEIKKEDLSSGICNVKTSRGK